MDHYYQHIKGWFGFAPAYEVLVANLPGERPSLVVELGTFLGRSSAFLGVEIANSGKPVILVCIDRFPESRLSPLYPSDTFEAEFHRNLEPVANALGNRFRVISGDSADNAKEFEDESVDAVWIDADHEAVLRDIDAWWPKLRVGGLMGGDDWAWTDTQGNYPVCEAVIRRFGGRAQTGCLKTLGWPWWWVRKGEAGKAVPV